ncbi:hypothetical protein WNY51_10515 [Pseudocolwellia sp. AS88]|uniref:hypothetical protein n=1 Tax=Pseudocolwellia sp. AS88 TaxID=3063958 RepID=UPI0026EE7953|nr:hypothetical protein [Pseudocolwellia sp. AS88]MDO7085998.1 hypothetical protein [Pseudocolwellia sp. AS88]
MNKSAIAKFIGVFVSLLVIWVINDLLLIQPCVNEGGVFQYEKGQCLLEDGNIFTTGFEMPLVVLYVVIGFGVSYFVSRIFNKIFAKK